MIKLINYDYEEEGHVFYISKDNIGDMVRGKDVTWIYTKGQQPATYKVKETPEEIFAMPDIETSEKVIDWEQRRYEIAKEILKEVFTFGEPECTAMEAVRYADALIKELKKGDKK